MLRKITDCNSLKISQKKTYDGVLSVKLQAYNFTIKITHHRLILGYVPKTSCFKKNILRKKYMVDKRLNKVAALYVVHNPQLF